MHLFDISIASKKRYIGINYIINLVRLDSLYRAQAVDIQDGIGRWRKWGVLEMLL